MIKRNALEDITTPGQRVHAYVKTVKNQDVHDLILAYISAMLAELDAIDIRLKSVEDLINQ